MRKPAAKRLDDPHREFVSLFKDNCHRHRPHSVFSDFCEMAALSMSNAVDLSQYAPREARYLEIVKGYSADEVACFPKMLACVTDALEARMHDCLGQLFMSLEMGNHWKGQFFTPYELAGLMARMTVHDAKEQIQQRGHITVMEPAAGAGAMVIAIADAMREQGLNYQQCLHVTAIDVDPTAAHMCYVQLTLLHVPAVVVVGNSLSLEERGRWFTPAHVLEGWGRRLRERQAVTDMQALLLPASATQDETAADVVVEAAPSPSHHLAPLVQADLF